MENADWQSVRDQLAAVAGVADITAVDAAAVPLVVKLKCRSDSDVRGDVYRTVKRNDWILLEFFQEAQNLETIFRELTREI
jgi:hypothetical protein